MSPAHRTNILHHTQPHTVKDMLSFLGLVGYSRHYIPNFTGLTQQLRALVREIGMHNLTASLNWTLEAEQAFIRLKQALAKSCDLAIPDYTLPFHLDVSETDSVVNGVLFQKKGGDRTTLTYLSIMLDPMEKRHPSCTRHAAGVAKLITKCAHIVMGHPLHVLTSHSIVAYVNSQTFTMTSLRQQRLSKVLEAPNLLFTHEGINMADRIGHGPTHECATRVTLEDKARPDLKTSPIAGADDVYTDGCCFRHPQEGLKAGYAVVKRQRDDYLTVTAERLKGAPLAPRAEVVALIEALKSAPGQKVNIYTDSAYAVHAAQVDLGQWIRAGFRTASQTPIKHEEEMRELVDALQLPEEVAILKCRGHDSGNSPQARGNQAADTAAKKAAGYQVTMCMVRDDCEDRQNMLTLSKIGEEQDKASPQEKSVWVQRGAKKADGIWRSADGRLVMPPGPRESLLQEAHGVGHHGAAQMRKTLEEWWHPYLQDMIAHVGKTCPECTNYNVKPPYKPGPGRYELKTVPGKEIIIDFTDMIQPVRGCRYILMCVDAYTGWPEAWPARKEDSKTVIKCLINHYIPQHGFPEKIRSDNGTHFKNQDLQQVEAMLELRHGFGSVYHPQSQGKVERMNQTVKVKLSKICAQTGLNWVDALPLTLLSIRSSVNRTTGHTPFELEHGRPFPGPNRALHGGREDRRISHKEWYNQTAAVNSYFAKQISEDPRGTVPELPLTDWVLLRVIKRKWSEPRWTGPFLVTERTSHAVRLEGKGDTWYHLLQCAPGLEPQRTLQETAADVVKNASKE
ncbi:protein NYNRIN-like isoform X1 [Embiotoca jacksoni]|uniref:protein NYNRIN-like isoform X1 n=1 Tax=Embiotoca jacksoni TaxID=100190 RepID=UPI00370418C2